MCTFLFKEVTCSFTLYYDSLAISEYDVLMHIITLQGTNMLSGLLDVRTATARQAVITAIDLLGIKCFK